MAIRNYSIDKRVNLLKFNRRGRMMYYSIIASSIFIIFFVTLVFFSENIAAAIFEFNLHFTSAESAQNINSTGYSAVLGGYFLQKDNSFVIMPGINTILLLPIIVASISIVVSSLLYGIQFFGFKTVSSITGLRSVVRPIRTFQNLIIITWILFIANIFVLAMASMAVSPFLGGVYYKFSNGWIQIFSVNSTMFGINYIPYWFNASWFKISILESSDSTREYFIRVFFPHILAIILHATLLVFLILGTFIWSHINKIVLASIGDIHALSLLNKKRELHKRIRGPKVLINYVMDDEAAIIEKKKLSLNKKQMKEYNKELRLQDKFERKQLADAAKGDEKKILRKIRAQDLKSKLLTNDISKTAGELEIGIPKFENTSELFKTIDLPKPFIQDKQSLIDKFRNDEIMDDISKIRQSGKSPTSIVPPTIQSVPNNTFDMNTGFGGGMQTPFPQQMHNPVFDQTMAWNNAQQNPYTNPYAMYQQQQPMTQQPINPVQQMPQPQSFNDFNNNGFGMNPNNDFSNSSFANNQDLLGKNLTNDFNNFGMNPNTPSFPDNTLEQLANPFENFGPEPVINKDRAVKETFNAALKLKCQLFFKNVLSWMRSGGNTESDVYKKFTKTYSSLLTSELDSKLGGIAKGILTYISHITSIDKEYIDLLSRILASNRTLFGRSAEELNLLINNYRSAIDAWDLFNAEMEIEKIFAITSKNFELLAKIGYCIKYRLSNHFNYVEAKTNAISLLENSKSEKDFDRYREICIDALSNMSPNKNQFIAYCNRVLNH